MSSIGPTRGGQLSSSNCPIRPMASTIRLATSYKAFHAAVQMSLELRRSVESYGVPMVNDHALAGTADS